TIRLFAWERLMESGEAGEAREAHARYYLDMVESTRQLLRGPEQALYLQRWEQEHDNLRAALAWGLETDPAFALRLAVGLWPFWYARAHLSEGRKWLAVALEAAHDAPLALRAQALNAAWAVSREQGDGDQAGQ